MHRFVALLLGCLYLTAFSGATVTVHYCAGSVSSVSIDEAYQSQFCNKCEAKKESCCRDKQAVLQVSSKHEPALQQASFEKGKPVSLNQYDNLFQPAPLTSYCLSYLHRIKNSDPPVPLYISYCVYRI